MTWEHRPIPPEKSDAVLHEEYKRVVGRSTFRSEEPIGRGTMSQGYVDALKVVGADPELIEWAEARLQGRLTTLPPKRGCIRETLSRVTGFVSKARHLRRKNRRQWRG